MGVIADLMKTDLVTATTDETVAHAAYSMARNGVGAVLVIEGEKLAGVLSERDVMARVVAEGRDPTSTRVAEVATADVITADVDVSLRECASLLQSRGIRHLPIVKQGKPVGILSTRDFMAYVAGGLERLVLHARYREALAEGDDPYDHLGGAYGD
jgi:CBS domain-containing protein